MLGIECLHQCQQCLGSLEHVDYAFCSRRWHSRSQVVSRSLLVAVHERANWSNEWLAECDNDVKSKIRTFVRSYLAQVQPMSSAPETFSKGCIMRRRVGQTAPEPQTACDAQKSPHLWVAERISRRQTLSRVVRTSCIFSKIGRTGGKAMTSRRSYACAPSLLLVEF